MKEFLAALDSLIKRGLSSSLTFFSLLFVSEWVIGTIGSGSPTSLLASWGAWSSNSLPSSHSTWATVLAVLFLVIGLSYTLSTLNELIYENTLRENFDSWVPWVPYNRTMSSNFTALRQSVIAKLEVDVPGLSVPHATDFYLYEVLGGILPTNTRPYVDAAKAIGLVFVSAILVGFVELLVHGPSLSGGHFAFLSVLCVLVYLAGREAIKTQYRSRALRLYVNFLMMPSDCVQKKLSLEEMSLPSDDANLEAAEPPAPDARASRGTEP